VPRKQRFWHFFSKFANRIVYGILLEIVDEVYLNDMKLIRTMQVILLGV